jgi:hypothetical protein
MPASGALRQEEVLKKGLLPAAFILPVQVFLAFMCKCKEAFPKQEVYLNQHPKGYGCAGIVFLHHARHLENRVCQIYLSLPNQQNQACQFFF